MEQEEKVRYILEGYDKENLIDYLMDIMSFEGRDELVDNYEEVSGEIKD